MKRKTAITVYLFTAAIFLTALYRFSVEEKMKVIMSDSDRISDIAIVSGDVYYYDESKEVFSYTVMFTEFSLPLESGIITSDFGYRSDPFGEDSNRLFHNGMDVAVENGSSVFSVSEGKVLTAEYDSVGGNYIKISHENGFVSYYGHLSKICVKEGEEVATGQIIGLSGESGKVTGPHLHFSLFYKDIAVDPDVYLNFKSLINESGQ